MGTQRKLVTKRKIISFLLAFAVILVAPRATAQDHHHAAHTAHDGIPMSTSVQPIDPAAELARQAKLLADKRESEFNHHLAGVLVMLAAVFILAGDALRRWPYARFIWPMCFLVAGLFLLVFSDTELWPFGHMSWWYGLTHRAEVLQHKTFAVILLIVAIVEMQRARGYLKAAWADWVFPILAIFGSVVLLFHEHHTGTHSADHMAIMERIRSQHLGFSLAGCGIGVTKGLSEARVSGGATFAKLWPVLMIVLGVLLLLYRE
jgi:putative copper resistance protein D